jgi:hypothetical protein
LLSLSVGIKYLRVVDHRLVSEGYEVVTMNVEEAMHDA